MCNYTREELRGGGGENRVRGEPRFRGGGARWWRDRGGTRGRRPETPWDVGLDVASDQGGGSRAVRGQAVWGLARHCP